MAKGLGTSQVPGAKDDRTQIGELDGTEADGSILVVTSDNGEVSRVGRYDVCGVLGRGGMGVVYEVKDRQTGSLFALKMIETRFLELAESNAEIRFRQEIDVLERLDHRGIVRLYDSGFARHPMGYEIAFFAMEKLNGDTLENDIKAARTFPLVDSLSIIRQLADAIDYLAKHSVLHRDIKPANVFREKDGRVVLMDFGLARSEEFTRLTLAGQIVGTFGYMSPERLTGRAFDATADVFALGVVLYQLLAGHHPWTGNSPTEMLEAIKRGLTIPPAFASLPAAGEVEALVRKMLAYKPPERFTPPDLRHRLDKLLDLVAPLPEKTKSGAKSRPSKPPPTSSFAPDEESSGMTPMTPLPERSPLLPPERTAQDRAPIITPVEYARPPVERPPVEQRPMASAPISMLPPPAIAGPTWSIATGLALAFGVFGFVGGILVGRGSSEEAPIAVPVSPQKHDVVVSNDNPVVVDRPTAKPKEAPIFKASSFDNPGEAFAYAETLLSAERYQDAIPILERALQLNPAYADAHRLLGDAHLGAGESERAAHHYKTYLALRPGAEDAADVKKKLKSISP